MNSISYYFSSLLFRWTLTSQNIYIFRRARRKCHWMRRKYISRFENLPMLFISFSDSIWVVRFFVVFFSFQSYKCWWMVLLARLSWTLFFLVVSFSLLVRRKTICRKSIVQFASEMFFVPIFFGIERINQNKVPSSYKMRKKKKD